MYSFIDVTLLYIFFNKFLFSPFFHRDLTQDNPEKDVWMKKHKIPFKVKHIINKAATLKAAQQRKNKH